MFSDGNTSLYAYSLTVNINSQFLQALKLFQVSLSTFYRI